MGGVKVMKSARIRRANTGAIADEIHEILGDLYEFRGMMRQIHEHQRS